MKGFFDHKFANPIAAAKSYSHPLETVLMDLDPVKKIRSEWDPFYDPFKDDEIDE